MLYRLILTGFVLLLIVINGYAQDSNKSGLTVKEFKFRYTINDPEFRAKIPKLKKSFVEILPGIDMSKREISNYDYLLFLKDLANLNPKRCIELENKFENMNSWTDYDLRAVGRYPLDSSTSVMDDIYYNHPGFYYYPVTCLNIEEINEYCDWLTSQSNGKYKYRLPSRKEWEIAQRGVPIDTGACIGEHWTYNIKMNDYNICNTNRLSDTSKYYPFYKYFGDGFFYTGPCYSYNPNSKRFYNMTGNVAEVINENNSYFVIGGSWDSYPQDCNKVMEFVAGPTVGFRLVRVKVFNK